MASGVIPIGKVLRRSASHTQHASQLQVQQRSISISTLEEQIAKLEKQVSSDESNVESEEDSSVEEGINELFAKVDREPSFIVEKDKDGKLLRLVSTLQTEERIAPLPASLLPSSQCRFTDKVIENVGKKRKIIFSDEVSTSKKSSGEVSKGGLSGLKKTIQEMMNHYQPASLEKRPNYCRVCKFQGINLEELNSHRASDSHKEFVEMERRLCYCKLCRKQFTSPEQLKEHLKGKAHIDRLEKIRSSQVQMSKYVH